MNELMQFAQQILLAAQLGQLGLDEQSQMLVQLAQATLQGDQLAAQQLALIAQQMLQQALQQQVQAAKFGAKLNYIRQLRGMCPEGTEPRYFKEGGRVCKKCAQIQQEVENLKAPTDPIEAFRCGRKIQKANKGDEVNAQKGKPSGTKRKTVTYTEKNHSAGIASMPETWGDYTSTYSNGKDPLDPEYDAVTAGISIRNGVRDTTYMDKHQLPLGNYGPDRAQDSLKKRFLYFENLRRKSKQSNTKKK